MQVDSALLGLLIALGRLHSIDSSDIQVIASQNQSLSTSNPASTAPNPSQTKKRRAFFCHFKLHHKKNEFQSLAPDSKKKGKPCCIFLSPNLTSSTKSMSKHLKRVHQMHCVSHFPPLNLQYSITTGHWILICRGQLAFFNSGAAIFPSSPGTIQPSGG
ncbi:uncharacterized protein VP01_2820g1 [Puccinia sorghi]|uniref:BED-type domain-containing protein n=1 Tax=Puccinia sorghi TaxID=27349 RepID=A0A0L6V2B3_9BASI|nr:uncharacterized protein VP01_2820g1 [Puccinia sorghi]